MASMLHVKHSPLPRARMFHVKHRPAALLAGCQIKVVRFSGGSDAVAPRGDVHQTLETGRELAAALGEAISAADALVARMLEGEPARPFDIMDYKATVEEATRTVQEFQSALTTIERILGSTVTDEELNSILEGANRLEDEVVDDIIDHAFLRGVALIVIFFLVLALYRLLMRRLVPDLGSRPKADR